MWEKNLTTGEGTAPLFVAVGHCPAGCVGVHAAKQGNRFEVLEPIRLEVRGRFGGCKAEVARRLARRHDHGWTYIADDFRQEIRFLGIESSQARVRHDVLEEAA